MSTSVRALANFLNKSPVLRVIEQKGNDLFIDWEESVCTETVSDISKWNQLSTSVSEWSPRQRWGEPLFGVEPLEFDVTYAPCDEDNPAMLSPFKLVPKVVGTNDDGLPIYEHVIDEGKLKGKKLSETRIGSRVGEELAISGMMQLRNELIALWLSFDSADWVSNKMVRRLAHYIKVVGTDPFSENAKGRIRLLDTPDLMVSTRILVLMNAILMSRVHPTLVDVIDELALFIFADPCVHTLKIKDVTAVSKQVMSSCCKGGTRLVWPVWGTYCATPEPIASNMNGKINDQDTFDDLKEFFDEEQMEKEKLGLTKLAAFYAEMVHKDFDDEGRNWFQFGQFPETLAGFFRMDKEAAFRAQVEKDPGREEQRKQPLNPIYADHMRQLYDKMWEWARREKKVALSWERHVDRQRTAQTTRSNGTFSVQAPVSGPGIREGRQISEGTKVTGYQNAGLQLLRRDVAQDMMTADNPASIGSRSVSARRLRAIFVIPQALYMTELYEGRVMYAFINATQQGKYTVARMTGHLLVDHANGFRNSGIGALICLMSDFSQFDSTEEWYNAGIFRAEGLLKHSQQLGFGDFLELVDGEWRLTFVEGGRKTGVWLGTDGKRHGSGQLSHNFGPWHSPAEMLMTNIFKYANAWFQFDNGKEKVLLGPIDQRHSGEYTTLGANSFVSDSQQTAVMDRCQQVFNDCFSQESAEVMGDDQYTYINFMAASDSMTLRKMREIVSQVSTECGLIVKPSKTVIRRFYYEYLKIHVVYGWFIPQSTSVQLFTAENSSIFSDPMARIANMRQFLQTLIARGHSVEFTRRYLMYSWAIMRYVLNFNKRTGGKRERVQLPHMCIHVPLDSGGGGLSIWNMVGANTDVTVFFYPDSITELMDEATAVCDAVRRSGMKDRLVRSMSDLKFEPGGASFRANAPNSVMFKDNQLTRPDVEMAKAVLGKNWARSRETRDDPTAPFVDPRYAGQGAFMFNHFMPQEKFKDASAALKTLTDRGIDIGTWTIFHAAERARLSNMKSSPKLASLELDLRSTFDIASGRRGLYTTKYRFWKGLKMQFTTAIDAKQVPFMQLDPLLQRRMSQLGLSCDQNLRLLDPEILIRKLRAAGLPQDISADTVIRLLSLGAFASVNDLDGRAAVLIAMGVDKDVAYEQATEISTRLNNGQLDMTFFMMSFGGQVERYYDISLGTINKIYNPLTTLHTLVNAAMASYSIFAPLEFDLMACKQIGGVDMSAMLVERRGLAKVWFSFAVEGALLL